MIRGLFIGIAACALTTGVAFAQDTYSSPPSDWTQAPADNGPYYGGGAYDRDGPYYRDNAPYNYYGGGAYDYYGDGAYDRDGGAYYNGAYDRGPYYDEGPPPVVHDYSDPGAHALGGGVAGAGLGAAIGCLVTIPIGCAPGAAIGAAVGGGTGAIAGAASTPPPREYYPPGY